jgi:serine protease
VAATVGAVGTNNKAGVAGVAWNVTILPIRVLTVGGASDLDIIDAMRWAAGLPVEGLPKNEHPADIINMSLGGPHWAWDQSTRQMVFSDKCDPAYLAAIKDVRRAGAVVVVAAGNGEWQTATDGPCVPGSPGCTERPKDLKYRTPAQCPYVITVAASDMFGRLAPYSNYGAASIMAPGGGTGEGAVVGPDGRTLSANVPYGQILSAMKAGNQYTYYWKSGTSMAAPHVAGAIALKLAVDLRLRHEPDLVASTLRAAAVPVQRGACPRPCGPGQLDAAVLLRATPR